MKISHFQILKAVVDTSSFSAAAAELGCTQSNVSYAIAEIEKYANAKLLHRSRTGCTPTLQGLETIQKSIKLLEIFDDIRNTKKALSGVVRIGCFRSLGAILLTPILQDVSKAHAGIEFEIFDDTEEQGDIERMVSEGKVDIALARGMDYKSCIARPFFTDDYLLVVPAILPPLPPADMYKRLEALNFIQHDNSCARAVTQQLRGQGFAPRVFRNIGSTQSVIASVSSGMGYSILPRLALAQCQGDFRTLALPQPVSRDFSVISRPSSLLSAAANCVLKYLRDQKLIQNIARRH